MTQLAFDDFNPSNFSDPLDAAKEALFAHLDEGIDCPLCEQHCQRYYRRVGHYQVVLMGNLWRLMQAHPNEWFHIKVIQGLGYYSGGGDFAKLKWWGLVEEHPTGAGEDKRSSGRWRLTARGIDFLRGLISIPKYAMIYNNGLHGFDGAPVTVTECLKKGFSYRELLTGIRVEDPYEDKEDDDE